MQNTTVEYKVYTFDQLPENEKQKAIEKEIEAIGEWWEAETEYYERFLDLAGFTDIEIAYSGFWSQGDGASFTGRFDAETYRDNKKLKAEYKHDKELLEYSVWLNKIFKQAFYKVSGTIKRCNNHYVHENSTEVTDIYHNDLNYDFAGLSDIEKQLKEWMISFNKYIYREFEKQYYSDTSEEMVIDNLKYSDIVWHSVDGIKFYKVYQ